MKKLIVASVFALGVVTAVNAQEKKQPTAMNEAPVKEMTLQAPADDVQDFKDVKASDVPQEVKASVEKTYKGATISSAAKNDKGVYKLVLTAGSDATDLESTNQTVYLNSKGEFIKM
ncbi:hypothetical protein [Ulvibacter litoralis]|uniref:Beta-lactamase-inhibitor-like, PepSY-like n=1 Tax=Ulvibacter litoralis TaxID=227084 RepID=A0A1G7CTJ1_9FLAO|nr:hypothetical protein [Ulvibacter litoralis]GHC46129.1 hypothetical protein GCM10008083_06380 [Ulvibacter litoralis]SDE42617.1 hypothetical protein SAMN05421855_101558 [Ulvibacter litoralis]